MQPSVVSLSIIVGCSYIALIATVVNSVFRVALLQGLAEKVMYSDAVSLSETVEQVSIRDGSIEMNRFSNESYGYRVNVSGCWIIVSSNRYSRDELERLRNKALNIVVSSCGELSDAELYSGRIEIGREFPEFEETSKLLYDLCSEAKGYGVQRCEVDLLMRSVSRSIERESGENAYELKKIVEVEIALMRFTEYGLPIFVSDFVAMVSWHPNDVLKNLERVFKTAVDKSTNMSRLRSLKPYLYGRAQIILDHTASASIFHEVSHILDASYIYSQRVLGVKICSDEVEVYDEPYNYQSPSVRFFDDEGVVAKKRTLIEGGVVRDLHHTRLTAKQAGSEPGSAHGLFHTPVPFHTSLVVKAGDWRYGEILEDTKKGFYVGGVTISTLEEGYIRLVPEYGYLIEDGELKEMVKIREVKIPLKGLKTISAISRDVKVRTSYEKSWLVSEISPMIRLEAYVQ